MHSVYCIGSGAISSLAMRRHSIAEYPGVPSPSHSRSGSSDGHSSRRSSRDSGRLVASPSHHHHHHPGAQRTSSVSSAERSSASPVNISSYEQMLNNGTTNYIRRNPGLQTHHGGTRGGTVGRDSPSGTTRLVTSRDQQMVAPGCDHRVVSSSEQNSPSSRYVRKPHHYEIVRLPHGYEEVDFSGQQDRPQFSQASTRSEVKLNSKRSRFSRRGSSEKRPNSGSNQMHMSDSRLNKITKRRTNEKSFNVKKSPALAKRYSVGNVVTEANESRNTASIKAKYRVSNPEPCSEQRRQQFLYDGTAGREDVNENPTQEDGSSGDHDQVRRECWSMYMSAGSIWYSGTDRHILVNKYGHLRLEDTLVVESGW